MPHPNRPALTQSVEPNLSRQTDRFRGCRHIRDLTHHHIATRVGTPAQASKRVETGTLVPERPWSPRSKNALGCTIDGLTTTGDPLDNDP